MTRYPEDERRWAVARIEAGDSITTVAARLGARGRGSTVAGTSPDRETTWAEDRSHRPTRLARLTPAEVVEAVRLVRLSLYNQGLLCGAQNIRWELDELGSPRSLRPDHQPHPRREGLTHRRTGRYTPKGTPYPTLPAERPNQVHQVDYLGPATCGAPCASGA